MKKIALVAAVAATFAAPAFAQSAREIAVAHFNASADNVSERITLNPVATATTVSTRGNSPLATAFDIFNRSQDTLAEQRGLNGATIVSGTPSYGADVFARLRAAALEDE